MQNKMPEWIIRGKSVRELIQDLSSFGDQSLEARISLDGGLTSKPISIVKKADGVCLIVNMESMAEQDFRSRMT